MVCAFALLWLWVGSKSEPFQTWVLMWWLESLLGSSWSHQANNPLLQELENGLHKYLEVNLRCFYRSFKDQRRPVELVTVPVWPRTGLSASAKALWHHVVHCYPLQRTRWVTAQKGLGTTELFMHFLLIFWWVSYGKMVNHFPFLLLLMLLFFFFWNSGTFSWITYTGTHQEWARGNFLFLLHMLAKGALKTRK